MAKDDTSDRRRATRRDIRIPCQAVLDDDAGKACEMITRDVSHTGAFFETSHSVAVASKVKVLMNLGKRLVETVGEVVRIEAEGFAVAFLQAEVVPVRI